jgi:UDP-glucuronate 4-epimerase
MNVAFFGTSLDSTAKRLNALSMPILITGAAGFIGFHVSLALLQRGEHVMGVDNLNTYYDPALKQRRLEILQCYKCFDFVEADIGCIDFASQVVEMRPKVVVHLAAQAGVRYSIEAPMSYVHSNLFGTTSVLEGCRRSGIDHLVYASSSSVYGNSTDVPFTLRSSTDKPASLYAATKKGTEMLCHSYSSLYGMKCTGLRFFTVYGAWGRPDMAYFKFAESIYSGRSIDVYNNGQMERDFTHVSDITKGILAIIDRGHVQKGESAPHNLYNLGNNRPARLLDMIAMLERMMGRKAKKNMLPMQLGDVLTTFADVSDAQTDYGFCPQTSLEQGLQEFVEWFLKFKSGTQLIS